MRKERKYNYIYKTTCSVTGKYYIGMHSTDKLDDGYLGSGKRLWFSINYHGKDNHTKEILELCGTREELKKREEEIINEQLLKEDLCMNLMTGGQGGFSSEEHMLKATKAAAKSTNKKRWVDNREENLELASNNFKRLWKESVFSGRDVRDDKNPMFGKTHSKETKYLMCKKSKGKSNSQYGTCWITNGKENKKINKEELPQYQLEGWKRGRIMDL